MVEMGGLIRRIPKTAFFFLIGAVAISALPTLNGFASEWLTSQPVLQSFGTTESLTRLILPLIGAMLTLTEVLATIPRFSSLQKDCVRTPPPIKTSL